MLSYPLIRGLKNLKPKGLIKSQLYAITPDHLRIIIIKIKETPVINNARTTLSQNCGPNGFESLLLSKLLCEWVIAVLFVLKCKVTTY